MARPPRMGGRSSEEAAAAATTGLSASMSLHCHDSVLRIVVVVVAVLGAPGHELHSS